MTKGAIKAIAIGLSALFIGATVAAGVGSAVGGKPFQNPHIETWFNNWGKPTASTPQEETRAAWGGVVDGDGNEMNNNVATYAMPAAMAFYSDVAMTSTNELYSNPTVTVTCSHNFELNNILVDWSIEYPSGASATDIITVTPESDGSTIATLQCSAPFDTTITLKATLRGNPEKTAICTMDYIKRINKFNSVRFDSGDFGEMCGITCVPVFGIGTVGGTLKVSQITFDISESFKNDIQRYLKFPISFKSYTMGNLSFRENYNNAGIVYSYNHFIEGFGEYDEAHKNAIYYAWNAAFKNGNYQNSGNILFNANMELLYNGKVIQNFSKSDYANILEIGYLSGSTLAKDLIPDLSLNENVAF